MAKQKLVAKVRFDDGTKKGENGKAVDYNIGDLYEGDAEQAAAAKKAGLVCGESELTASKEVVDEKDRTIRSLEAKLDAALKENQALRQENDELKSAGGDEQPVKKPGRKSKKDEQQPENPEQ